MFFQTFFIVNLCVRNHYRPLYFHPLHFLLQPPHLNIKSILPNKYIYIYSCYHSFYSSNFFLIQNSSFMILLRVCISFPFPFLRKRYQCNTRHFVSFIPYLYNWDHPQYIFHREEGRILLHNWKWNRSSNLTLCRITEDFTPFRRR